MIGDVRKHLEITPFVPFSVRLADGREYPVPTEMTTRPPVDGRYMWSTDYQGMVVVLPALLISGLVHQSPDGAHQ